MMTYSDWTQVSELMEWIISNAEAISMERKKAEEAEKNAEKAIDEHGLSDIVAPRVKLAETPLANKLHEKIRLLNELHYLHGYQDGVVTVSGARRGDD